MTSSQLRVRGLHKRYGSVEALKGVSFTAEGGEIFGLLGPNGAGKTSTLECILGLRRVDAGEIQLGSLDLIANPAQAKAVIGAQLQSALLPDKITPREALKLFGGFYPQSRDIDELLEEYQLAEKGDAAFASLSGGQKQKLFLALAFIHSPRLVVLDEPTVGLDPNARRELHAAIIRARADGCTIVLSTHDLAEAEQLCDRIAIIDHGSIVATDTAQNLIRNARTQPRVCIRTNQEIPLTLFEKLADVTSVTRRGEDVVFTSENVNRATVAIVQRMESAHLELTDLRIQRPSLEDVFFELTGRLYSETGDAAALPTAQTTSAR